MTKHTETAPMMTTTEALGITESALTSAGLAADALNVGLPYTALRDIRNARQTLALMEDEAVRQMRAAGEPWSLIGTALGITKQAAQQRFGD